MKIVKKALHFVLITFLSIILLINGIMLCRKLVYNEALPQIFGYSYAVVSSGSMAPTLKVGDVAVYHQEPAYTVGDVIIFENGGSFVTHRIAEVKADGSFVTQGDANNTTDSEALQLYDIHGRMVLSIPAIGQAVFFLQSPLGILLIVLVGALLIEIPSILNSRKKRKGEESP